MSKIAIVTDSTADLPKKIINEYNISIVPLKVFLDDEVFKDGIDLTPQEFYQKLEKTDKLPTTSQPSPGEFVEVYNKLGQNHDSIISIHLSSHFSGTYQSALLAKGMLPNLDINVVDSKSATMGIGLIVLEAAKMAKNGENKEAIIKKVAYLVENMKVYFAVDTLDYLEKGGRIGKASAFLGAMLNIKPILTVTDGVVHAEEKVRGKSKALEKLIEIVKDSLRSSNGKLTCAVCHANDLDYALKLHERVLEEIDCSEILITDIGSVIGTHTGPGTIGLIFYID